MTVEGEEVGVEVLHANVRRIPNHDIGLGNVGKEEVPDPKPHFGQFLGDRHPAESRMRLAMARQVWNVFRTKVVSAERIV